MEREFLEGSPRIIHEAEALKLSKGELARQMAALSIKHARDWDRIYYDELSRLPNVRAMREVMGALEEMFETQDEGEWNWFDHQINRVGVVYIDLDNFKKVNDKLGHEVGDAVIANVSMLLNQAVNGDQRRRGDMVFRAHTAGDEFIFILPFRTPDGDGVEDMIETIELPYERVVQPFLDTLQAYHTLFEDKISREEWMAIIGVSVGKAVYDPLCDDKDHPVDLEETIKLAETRMRAQKEQHKRGR